MSRFVEFTNDRGKTLLIKADCVVAVGECSAREVSIYTAGDGAAWIVEGTVPEVMVKLQGDPEPAKAADDIAGWWVNEDRVIYVIGFRPDGRIAYLWDNGRYTTHDGVESLDTWTRDPNRKGWVR